MSMKFYTWGQYPESFIKNQKRNLQRKANDNYNVERGILYYHQKGSSDWKQVPRTFEDKQKILISCHASTEGIRERYIS